MTIPSVEPKSAHSSPEANTQIAILPTIALDGTDPIRAELYGLESLQARARALAESFAGTVGRRAEGPLLFRLRQNHDILVRHHRRCAEAAGRGEPLATDAEWLLDNFYIVDGVLREVRHDLPRGYYRELPKLAVTELAGYPRIYALALALIAHTDSALDEAHITSFVQAFQSVTPLAIGELWAIPTMLRLGLLENLRRLAEQTSHSWDEHGRAAEWIAPLLKAGKDGQALPELTSIAAPTDPFVLYCLQALRREAPAYAVENVNMRLAALHIDVGEAVRRENQRQAVSQVSVGNCITSLRLLGALDWGDFFERISVVEAALREDPAAVYPLQDFATRDRYRQAVERLSRRSRFTELETARMAVRLASESTDSRRGHIGYYLIGPGLTAMRTRLGYRPRWHDRLLDGALRHPQVVYFGSVAVLTVLGLAAVGLLTLNNPPWVAAVLLLAALAPVLDVAVGVVNFFTTLWVPPRVLPKLELRDGIPADRAAIVVMPSMLTGPDSAASLLEKLEIHYLANSDPQLRFALLTDFADAPTEHLPADEGYVQSALNGVKSLNERYAPGGPPRFFVFHRRRRWNPAQGCWMGWERKRGKLDEFNRLLRGDANTTYTIRSTEPAELPFIRYVITLDADTQLPREAARRLIGTIAHPLNQARFDPQKGRVVEGYGLLQPRIGLHLPAARRSRFTAIWGTSAGIDPYSTAVSDVYQDLFGAGSFTGKGIYDLDAFEDATGNTFPENHILSHDLIEGNYARCGLATDIELFDDIPARYHAFARREHRWIRGDWQLLPWLGLRTPVGEPKNATRPNPLPVLERWKIFDNLRRSLTPPALVLWLVVGWLLAPASLPTSLALLVLGLPLLLYLFGVVYHTISGGSLTPIRAIGETLPATLAQAALAVVFLLYQAYLSVDAVARTLVRLLVTRRLLLEWETAASTEGRLGLAVGDFVRSMWQAPALALAITLLVALVHPEALPVAGFFLVLWFLAPLAAWWVSQPLPAAQGAPTPEETQELRRVARRTWGFFEKFVGAEDHWLPPDNFQEEPHGRAAHRTSPTNIGLYFVSALAAHDFGYLGLGALVDRAGKALDSLDKLDRYRGHFLNWYDTLTLKPLPPDYVSTVDSGNLMGCLFTLKQGLLEKVKEPVLGPSLAAGLADTLGLAGESLRELGRPAAEEAAQCHDRLETILRDLASHLKQASADLPGWQIWLGALEKQTETLTAQIRCLADLAGEAESRPGSVAFWARQFAEQVQAVRSEMKRLAPWAALLSDPNAEGHELLERLRATPRLVDFDEGENSLSAALAAAETEGGKAAAWLGHVRDAMAGSGAAALLRRCRDLVAKADELALAMDFKFLYKTDRHLFSIGYQVAHERLDAGCYDLLASEARLASFLAIARGDAPRRHWFHLGRSTTRVNGRPCLLSWGGTLFEYLMPPLLMRSYPGTLLAESCEGAVDRQRQYGRRRGVPWGVSESAFSSQYASSDYQYQSFGVPGLGLKRGLGQDLVVAPYATALAAAVRPAEVLKNFRRLAAEGAAGLYGFYEAIDYTRNRLPEGRRSLVVRCFMAHHQGMSLIALANCLLDEPMPRRFHAERMIRATELLLQERVPRGAAAVEPPEAEAALRPAGMAQAGPVSRRLTTPFTPGPRTHLLSHGRYSVMVTNAGGSYSRCDDLDITRWREDFTRDDAGQFCYIRDLQSGYLWSTGHHPVGRPTDQYEVLYSADKAEFRRVDGTIATSLEIAVSPQDAAEVRRVTLTNHDSEPHELELTSYAEIVLAQHGADLSHPAFGKLFLETEWLPKHGALLCRRRPRSPEQPPLWGVHVAAVGGQVVGEMQYETDRGRFLGRGRTPRSPAAQEPGAVLSGTTGAVLDPVFSLRLRVLAPPGASVSIAFSTAMAKSREEALQLADHYRDYQAVLRAFDLAWAHSQVELRHLQLSTEEAHLYQRLATHLLYAGPALRAPSAALAANRQGQPGLWRYGISGDRPILLLSITESEEVALARRLLAAHTYWRQKGLEVDLVILNEEATTYFDALQEELLEAVRASDARELMGKAGGVFLLKADHIGGDDRTLLRASARVELAGHRGSLAAQIARVEPAVTLPGALVKRLPKKRSPKEKSPTGASLGLLFFNGLGGFTPDGKEYVIRMADGAAPPAPWINVIANPTCGFLASESGLGCTWTGNSQLHRLTPWNNDPVSDPPGEVVYLRDERTGEVWTPTPQPCGGPAQTLVRHGQGYTTYYQDSRGLSQELTLFVPLEDPVKLIVLRLRNTGDTPRRLSATFYAEWVLGGVRDRAPLSVHTEMDAETGILLARNPFYPDFGEQVGFACALEKPRSFTADRTEFLGRNGSVEAPAALGRAEFSGRTGGGLDPCAALQTTIELNAGEEREIVFLLGSAKSVEVIRDLADKYRWPHAATAALAEVKKRWEQILGAVQVRTPDPALDVMLNRWLLYQVLSCRVWGRSAFYQSSGAYGFRDQLQDVMSLVHAAPKEARDQLLRAAGRQFIEGDVQHWWHPPGGVGVRTHFSDDFLWLPFAACRYVRATGDTGVLDEIIPYLRMPKLQPGQDEEYGLPGVSDETGTLYDHCVRSLRNGLHMGVHGLPLMGTGDWNDGMNRVGAGGKGESVWDAWFLVSCLRQFAEVADARNDGAWAVSCREEAERLRLAVEEHAWDGQWYRRAYFDDGTPLGSAENDECQIDSIVQTWAVLSGAADPKRAAQAMASVNERLVKRDAALILLFTPPFDDGKLQPGYIKGYVPGIRENGGQYTHAAAWVVQAAAQLGQGDLAMELFGLLNPVRHGATPADVARYRVEPYVLAGDVYGEPPHVGRGGWSWYTGSASWLYRAALESILGFDLHGDRLTLTPCVPKGWKSFELAFRHKTAYYHIAVVNAGGTTAEVTVDGRATEGRDIELQDDGGKHEISVNIR